MCIYCICNSMNVCKWCMSGSATENSILLSVLPRLNKIFNQSIKQPISLLEDIMGLNLKKTTEYRVHYHSQ